MINRRKFVFSLAATIPALGGTSFAQGNGKGHGNGKNKGDDDNGNGKGNGHGNGKGNYFRQQDYAVIQRYYQGPRDLPPGLQKKYARTGTLPPGWEKRFQPFPPALVAQLPPPPPNCERGYLDGRAIVYDKTTRVIVDSLDIVNALSGH